MLEKFCGLCFNTETVCSDLKHMSNMLTFKWNNGLSLTLIKVLFKTHAGAQLQLQTSFVSINLKDSAAYE